MSLPSEQWIIIVWGVLLLNAALMTAGLRSLFAKCAIRRNWAFVPFLRLYKLAQSADMEDAGLIWMPVNVAGYGFFFLYSFMRSSLAEREWMFIAALVTAAAMVIYGLRVFAGLSRILDTSRWWAPVWVVFMALPLMVWGFSKKVAPSVGLFSRGREAARDSGINVGEKDYGLTVNLKTRTVKDFKRERVLLRDVHLSLEPGRMVLLLGGSGAGKTTLINAITGYEKANAKIALNGADVYKHYNEMLYEIGVVPQQDLMRSNDTVIRTLTDAACLRLPEGMPKDKRDARVNRMLEIFGLSEVRSREVGKLSGGQRKRLSIALEFISDPSLFILDEPDSGLDGVLARDLMMRLKSIADDGRIVIVITHSPDRVADLFDDVIVLGKDAERTGRLVYSGSIEGAREFFGTDSMEGIVRMINREDEGGEGRADELIMKFAEVRNAE